MKFSALSGTTAHGKTTSLRAVAGVMDWSIGKQIAEVQGERAKYGKQLLKYLSEQLTKEFGAGFTERNLQQMRQFYLALPKAHTLCAELSWSHYRLLMRITDQDRRDFYLKECAECGWSVRQYFAAQLKVYHRKNYNNFPMRPVGWKSPNNVLRNFLRSV